MNSTSFMLSLSKSNFLNYLGTISSPIENSFFLIFIFYCSLIKSWNCDLTWTVEVPPSLLPTWKGRIKNTHYYTTWRECVGGGGGGLGLGLGHRVWLCMFMFINPLSLMSSCMSKSWTCFRMYRKVKGSERQKELLLWFTVPPAPRVFFLLAGLSPLMEPAGLLYWCILTPWLINQPCTILASIFRNFPFLVFFFSHHMFLASETSWLFCLHLPYFPLPTLELLCPTQSYSQHYHCDSFSCPLFL